MKRITVEYLWSHFNCAKNYYRVYDRNQNIIVDSDYELDLCDVMQMPVKDWVISSGNAGQTILRIDIE